MGMYEIEREKLKPEKFIKSGIWVTLPFRLRVLTKDDISP